MERQFNHHFYNRKFSNQVLPLVFYLTLPTVSCSRIPERGIHKQTKSQKQKLRDTTRLNNFIERKSVCSLLPFYALDNEEIQNMIPRHQPSSVSHKTIQKDAESQSKIILELQEEIKQLHLTTVHLRDSILNERNKYNELEKENSYLKTEVFKGEEKLRDAENVISNLHCDIDIQQSKLKTAESEILNLKKEVLFGENKQREISILKEEMFNKFNREIENNERIRKEYSIEVKGLKAEIRNLKSQVPSSDSVQVNGNQSATNLATINGTSGIKCSKSNKKASKGTVHQHSRSRTTDCDLQCHRCGSLYSRHQPNQCPAKNFLCGYCSKRGHHTLNCLQVCKGCGAKGRAYHRIEDCTAQNMNCAYCNVQGHLSHMCLEKRYDTEGF